MLVGIEWSVHTVLPAKPAKEPILYASWPRRFQLTDAARHSGIGDMACAVAREGMNVVLPQFEEPHAIADFVARQPSLLQHRIACRDSECRTRISQAIEVALGLVLQAMKHKYTIGTPFDWRRLRARNRSRRAACWLHREPRRANRSGPEASPPLGRRHLPRRARRRPPR